MHFSSKLNNDGDSATLYDDSGSAIDEFEYSSADAGKSFARIPDGGDWATDPQEPTEGVPNSPCDPRNVVINEVMPKPLAGKDWVELYNVGCADVDLHGWMLVDAAGNAKKWHGGTVIAAGAYLVVFFGNKLNNGGDTLYLLNADGADVDSFSYKGSSAGESWQRAPGGGPWYTAPGAPSSGSGNLIETTTPPATLAPGPPSEEAPCGGHCSGICFGTWNIQNFGAAKSGRPAVMAVIKQVLSRYDVAGIQELSQKPSVPFAWCGENTESVICDSIPDPATFAVKASPRIGDEQYVVMYKKAAADIPDTGKTYPDRDNIHARPPHAFEVNTKRGYAGRLVVAVTHTSPGNAEKEIHNFPKVTAWMQREFMGADHVLLAGDFNADGSYFSDEEEWPNSQLQPAWKEYVQLTDNSMDTTVASNDNTYDRIIVDRALGRISGHARVHHLQNIDMTEVFREGCSMGYVPRSLCDDDGLAGAAWEDFPEAAKTALAKEITDHNPVEVCLGAVDRTEFVALK